MHPIPALHLLLLSVAALCAGFVDAVAGGGGLITVPALLAAGLPPHLALGTNKGQSLFGSLAAALRYRHAGLIEPRSARITFAASFVGSLLGAALVLLVSPEVLRPVVLVLIVAAAIVVGVLRVNPVPRPVVRRALLVAGLIALVIGAYDGFFGPGAGTFFLAGFAAFLGLDFVRASAQAKVANFASNVAAALVFAHGGVIVWHIAALMVAGQLLGGFLGAHVAIRRGNRFVRLVAIAVSIALAVKVARDLYRGG